MREAMAPGKANVDRPESAVVLKCRITGVAVPVTASWCWVTPSARHSTLSRPAIARVRLFGPLPPGVSGPANAAADDATVCSACSTRA